MFNITQDYIYIYHLGGNELELAAGVQVEGRKVLA